MKLILSILLLFPLSVFAETLRIIQVPGPYAVSPEQVREIYVKSSYYFRELGLTFRVRYIARNSPCERWHSSDTRASELNCFSRNSKHRAKLVTYWMTPPFVEGYPPVAYIAGVAFHCGDVATGNATEASLITGEERINHSATTFAHEVAHNFCAGHIDTQVNLMHPDALSFVTDYGGILPVFEATKRQVKRGLALKRRT